MSEITDSEAYKSGVLAERERCEGIVRNMIQESSHMMGTADVDWYQSALDTVLAGMSPEECKFSLSREQEMKDAEAWAAMNERDRCAKIAESCIPLNENDGDFLKCGANMAREIASKIRSGK